MERTTAHKSPLYTLMAMAYAMNRKKAKPVITTATTSTATVDNNTASTATTVATSFSCSNASVNDASDGLSLSERQSHESSAVLKQRIFARQKHFARRT